MSDWKQCLLGSIAEVQTGPFGSQLKNEQYITGGTPVITVEHINAFRIQNIDYPSVTEDDRQRLARYSLNAGDIVFTRVGSVDLSAYVKPENQGWLFSSRMLRVRVSTVEVDSLFLSYFFRQEKFREYILNIAVGATMPSINTQILKDIPISYPPLPEQKAIASVLSSLDDKIDLLHRQNKTLEAMAETLFRQWFIEEASEDWEEVPLSEVAVIQNGYAFSSRDYVEKTTDEYEVLKMGHIDKNSTLKLNPKRDYVPRKPELKKFVLNYNDIVMPMTDMKDNVVILGVPALVDASDKYVLNQRVARIYLKEDSKLSSTYYLFLQLKDPDFIARLQSTANSGVQVNLSTQAIKDCPIVIPSVEKQAEHKKDIANFYDRLSNNRKKIQTLEKLRDTLLPKLMSGEVRIQYQTEEVA